MNCPHCGRRLLSPEAAWELEYAREKSPLRGGYIWAGARPKYEAGEYQDTVLDELLAGGFLRPHADPGKGWIPR